MATKKQEIINKDNRALVRMWEDEETLKVSLKRRIRQ
jgi:hypothetical protein